MTYWQAWIACGLLMSLPAAAQADIYRWDDGQLIPGTEGYTPRPGVDFGSFNLRFADFSGGLDLTEANFYGSSLDESRFNGANLTRANLNWAILTNADLSGTNLTDASLEAATLTNANLAGAIVTGANLTAVGFTNQQLYSTASYQQRNLRGIGLSDNDLTGWDFSGQDLTNARLWRSECGGGAGCSSVAAILTNANFAGAMVTGAVFNGTTPHGFTMEQLYSTASYQQRNLRGIGLSDNDLTGWDFSGHDLTGAVFSESTLTNANLTGAVVTGAGFHAATSRGFTAAQLYSTQSYQAKNLSGIALGFNDLTGWDFSGQYLMNANFHGSRLTNANFSFADLRGAQMYSESSIQLARNTIREFGAINGLDLAAGETLVVRDSDIGITVNHSMNAVSGGTLELVLGDADWGSTVSFEPAIPVTLDGTLELTFADNMDIASQIGRTFDLFDWTGVNPTGAFAISSPYAWDLSNLYTTGEVTLTAIPEPSTALIVFVGSLALAARCRPTHVRLHVKLKGNK